MFVHPWRKPIEQDADSEKHFGDNPLDGTKINVVDVSGEREVVNIYFGEEVVCSRLAVRGTERCPSRGRPPSDDEAEETAPFGSTGFRCPTCMVN
jgi:hypothetical protein